MKGEGKKGRPKLYGEDMVLTNFRFPKSLLEDLSAAQHALGKPSVAEVVREALKAYLEANAGPIRAYKKLREKHR